MEEDQDYFLVQYWRERGFARISDMPGKSHLIDQNIPPEVLAVDMIREAGESERAYQNYNPYARLKTVFPDKAVLKTGVDTSSAGILSNPALSSWSADSEPLLLSTVFDVLLKDNPELEHLLTMSGLNYGVPHHYYMAYMHNLLIFSEFIAIASLLEQMNGMNETWILSNMQPLSVDSEGDRSLLALNGIRDVVVKDLNNNESRYYTTGLESGRKVNVVLLPPIVNDLDYASLFAKSRQPVGVTGNSSLFLAIALRKLPIYDINVPFIMRLTIIWLNLTLQAIFKQYSPMSSLLKKKRWPSNDWKGPLLFMTGVRIS